MTKKKQKNFRNTNRNSTSFLRQIRGACESLFYVSETDAPVLAFSGLAVSEVNRKTILQQTGGWTGDSVKELAFDEFFGRLTTVKDWFGETQRMRAKKFLDLQKLIEENLSNLKVFKIGHVLVQIYAVGIDRDGNLMGITTSAVET